MRLCWICGDMSLCLWKAKLSQLISCVWVGSSVCGGYRGQRTCLKTFIVFSILLGDSSALEMVIWEVG